MLDTVSLLHGTVRGARRRETAAPAGPVGGSRHVAGQVCVLHPGRLHVGLTPPTRIRRTRRIMDYMIATGLAAEFDVRPTRRSSRSEPALGTLPERGLAAGKRSVLPVAGVAAVEQALSNSQPIRSGRLCAGTSTGLAVDNATVRLARSHVHTGFTERLPGLPSPRRGPGFPTLWGTPWDAASTRFCKPIFIQSLTAESLLTLPECTPLA